MNVLDSIINQFNNQDNKSSKTVTDIAEKIKSDTLGYSVIPEPTTIRNQPNPVIVTGEEIREAMEGEKRPTLEAQIPDEAIFVYENDNLGTGVTMIEDGDIKYTDTGYAVNVFDPYEEHEEHEEHEDPSEHDGHDGHDDMEL